MIRLMSDCLLRPLGSGGGQHITSERLSVVSARALSSIESFISGHSLRVGTAVSLAQAGVTLVDMQTAGRMGRSKNARSLRKS